MILRSETCACYRDDDGLHPCDDFLAADLPGALVHLQKAFNLHVAPEPPKRAVKTGIADGVWDAPCGCRIDLNAGISVRVHCPELHKLTHTMSATQEVLNHIAQAVAAVMREQALLEEHERGMDEIRAGRGLTVDQLRERLEQAIEPDEENQKSTVGSKPSPQKMYEAMEANQHAYDVGFDAGYYLGLEDVREQGLPTDEEITAELERMFPSNDPTSINFVRRDGARGAITWLLNRGVPPLEALPPTDEEIEAAYMAWGERSVYGGVMAWRAAVKWMADRRAP